MTDGDFVVTRWTAAGTHEDTWEGVVPATGNRVEWTGNTIFRLECGKIAEEWSEADALAFFNQLGVIDWPQQPPAAPTE